MARSTPGSRWTHANTAIAAMKSSTSIPAAPTSMRLRLSRNAGGRRSVDVGNRHQHKQMIPIRAPRRRLAWLPPVAEFVQQLDDRVDDHTSSRFSTRTRGPPRCGDLVQCIATSTGPSPPCLTTKPRRTSRRTARTTARGAAARLPDRTGENAKTGDCRGIASSGRAHAACAVAAIREGRARIALQHVRPVQVRKQLDDLVLRGCFVTRRTHARSRFPAACACRPSAR